MGEPTPQALGFADAEADNEAGHPNLTVREKFDFKFDRTTWKQIFGFPGPLLQGRCTPCAFLIARVVLAFLWFAVCVWSIVFWIDKYGFGTWVTKLTHWGAIVELVYFTLAAYTTAQAIHGSLPDGTGDATPLFARGAWLCSYLAFVLSFIICVLYWALVYDPTRTLNPITVFTHGVNFLLALLDLLIAQTPFYLAHVYLPMLFCTTYVLFSLVYYWAGGTNQDGESRYIYKALNWDDPSSTGSLAGLGVLLGVPAIFLMFWCVVRGAGSLWRSRDPS